MVIYYETIFIDNIILNYLVLFIYSKFCSQKIALYKLTLASVLSTICTIVLIVIDDTLLNSLVVKAAVALTFCFVFFGLKDKRSFIKHLFILGAICFCVSGCLYFFVTNLKINMTSNYLVYSKQAILRIICGIIFIISTYKIYIYINKTTFNKKIGLVKLSISFKNTEISLYGFQDTGNMLFDCYHAMPIVLVTKAISEKLIKDKEFDFLKLNIKTVNGISKIDGFKVDHIMFDCDKNEHACIVGIIDQSLDHDCIYNPNYFI
jgi:stage II sporulation protein GA (sporulation sigma-E factor processing peptidase)